MTASFPDEERMRLASIGDALIPAAHGMPAASEVGVGDAQLDLVLAARPDLAEALHRGLAHVAADPRRLFAALEETDTEAFGAIVLAILGGYYMHPDVRRRLGYPGQVPIPPDVNGSPEWEREGLLDGVRRRGRIYREA